MAALVLMGSGETAPTMMPVHRRVLADAGSGPAVMLDTTFGFQTNANELVDKTRTYFRDSVGRDVAVASWRRQDVPTIEREKALATLAGANWVFAGPGSPSYALRQWAGTAVPDALKNVVSRGGTVCLGSAAAVLAGAYAIPVYEIYKGGADPYWLEGVNLLGDLFGLNAAVIPHFDNKEGGHYDTRFCYLGEQRLEMLEAMLPEGYGVLGVDEHTAIIIDPDARTVEVAGNGAMTLRVRGESHRFATGTVLPLDQVAALLSGTSADFAGEAPQLSSSDVAEPADETSVTLRAVTDQARARFDGAIAQRSVDHAVAAVLDLEESIREWSNDMQVGDDDYARRTLRAMIVRLGEVAEVGARDPRDVVAPYVDTLLEIRAAARAAKDFATSDLVRDRLGAIGVEVRDTPDGQTWHLGDGDSR